MIHAGLDTNVLASGVLRFEREESVPAVILRAWYAAAFVLVTSDHLIAEITPAGRSAASILTKR